MKVQSVRATGLNTASAVDAVTSDNSDFSSYLKTTNTLEQIFEEAAETYGVPKDLLKAVAMTESAFKPDATSKAGAQGIMQLMPATAKYLGVTDAYDPYQNIMGGAKFLSELLEQFDGNVSYALAGYNAGPNNVLKYGGIPPFTETQNYVVKVMSYLQEGVTVPNVSYAVPGTHQDSYYESILEQIFSYEDYMKFLEMYLSIQDFQNRQEKEEEEDQGKKSDSYYNCQGIKYNPAVLNLIRQGEGV